MVTYFYIAKGYIIVTGNNNKLVNILSKKTNQKNLKFDAMIDNRPTQ